VAWLSGCGGAVGPSGVVVGLLGAVGPSGGGGTVGPPEAVVRPPATTGPGGGGGGGRTASAMAEWEP
jgi:hypothetical protein